MSKRKNKYFRTLLLTISLLIIHSTFSIATVRYVSKTGSSTPPYTSWATAADSIQKCIDICVFGDTIYVANGVYKEEVTMIAGLSLMGAGSDSCIIDTRSFSNPQSVGVNRDCLLRNFKIIVQPSAATLGFGIVIGETNSIIEFNEVLNARSAGLWSYWSNAIFRHNKILNCDDGIDIEGDQPTFDSNYIYTNVYGGTGVAMRIGSNPILRGNVIILDASSGATKGINGGFNWSAQIFNNSIYTVNGWWGMYTISDEQMYNNVVVGNFDYGIWLAHSTTINNVIAGGEKGIRREGSNPPIPVIQYNDVWNNETNYYNHTPDSTNISLDPMFVDEDSLDFHLQMFSPLIDAGDPNILDIDGSRSDIGLYGGPYGEIYTYRDLAPKPPKNITAEYDSGLVKLTWDRNTEADFFRYRVYRDTVENFMYDSTKLVAVTADTFYYDVLPEKYIATSYYYKLTAIDSTGHQSAASEEVNVIITGAPEGPPVIVEEYKLLNNYPNPFNSSTIIPYRLKEPGYVKLYVYDIKGEVVKVLVNEHQSAGYYEVVFSPTSEERMENLERAGGQVTMMTLPQESTFTS
ncbi:MAG: hypothetical protein KJN64_07965 [Ignavibacteria bacterium]|nr:hypothetical protein [Ignavibacteria bacterium]